MLKNVSKWMKNSLYLHFYLLAIKNRIKYPLHINNCHVIYFKTWLKEYWN